MKTPLTLLALSLLSTTAFAAEPLNHGQSHGLSGTHITCQKKDFTKIHVTLNEEVSPDQGTFANAGYKAEVSSKLGSGETKVNVTGVFTRVHVGTSFSMTLPSGEKLNATYIGYTSSPAITPLGFQGKLVPAGAAAGSGEVVYCTF